MTFKGSRTLQQTIYDDPVVCLWCLWCACGVCGVPLVPVMPVVPVMPLVPVVPVVPVVHVGFTVAPIVAFSRARRWRKVFPLSDQTTFHLPPLHNCMQTWSVGLSKFLESFLYALLASLSET
jgi:hypothetical protein